MSETADIITAWLKEEYPSSEWTSHEYPRYNYTTNKQEVVEAVSATIGGILLELKINKDLDVGIWTKTPFKQASKVREVRLTDPTSIADLQEVVKHTIKITTNPFLPPK
jgi:hypothetical protein